MNGYANNTTNDVVSIEEREIKFIRDASTGAPYENIDCNFHLGLDARAAVAPADLTQERCVSRADLIARSTVQVYIQWRTKIMHVTNTEDAHLELDCVSRANDMEILLPATA